MLVQFRDGSRRTRPEVTVPNRTEGRAPDGMQFDHPKQRSPREGTEPEGDD